MVAGRSIGPGGYIVWGVYYLVLGVLHVPFALLSVLFCVGCMGDSDSESDYELHAVDSAHDGDPDEAFVDVCVTGADGAGAAPSAAVAHACSSVSNVKKQTTITAFFE